MSTDTLEQQDTTTTPVTDDGEHDKFSHYVRKEKILEAQINGVPARAICGKTWVPSSDPEKYPICPTCKEIFEDDGKFLDNDA